MKKIWLCKKQYLHIYVSYHIHAFEKITFRKRERIMDKVWILTCSFIVEGILSYHRNSQFGKEMVLK